jgi:hypothetical protein
VPALAIEQVMLDLFRGDAVPSGHDTASPRLKSHPSPRALVTGYTLAKDEVALAEGVIRSEIARLAFLILLKTFQRLGYFVQLRDVPRTIAEHSVHTQLPTGSVLPPRPGRPLTPLYRD